MEWQINPEEPWYHGSNRDLTVLSEGSTVTQWRELAEAFSHKPSVLCEDGGRILHNGREEGFLYVLAEKVAPGDGLRPHPASTMEPGLEFLTTRPVPLKKIAGTGKGVSQSSFFSMVFRMKYISRWGLMRNANRESLSEHSLDTAILAHALAVLGVRRLHKTYDPQRAAVLALYHDAQEILTGDLPTPVKYHDVRISQAYKQVEAAAGESLLSLLPQDLREAYRPFFFKSGEDEELWRLVKAADKLSALIKCVEEEKSGNTEFLQAKKATLEALRGLKVPELSLFMAEFYDSFTKTLDEQTLPEYNKE